MEGQLTEQEKANRSNVLIELEREQSKEFRKKRIGTKITVLLEEQKMIDGKTYMIGHTPEYIQAAFETEEDLSNQVIEGTATEFLTDEILLLSERSQIIR